MTIHSKSVQDQPVATTSRWKQIVSRYEQPGLRRSLWQLINTLVPYAVLWYLMYLSLGVSYWLTGALALLAAGFQVRIFIIFHDCGHGSFFKSKSANHILGFITGVLSFTPYYHWRWEHALHHASAGDLDRRGAGDMWTLTVQEYLKASRWQRFAYRLARNPLILFVVAPVFLFAVKQRFASSKAPRRERRSVYWTNLALLAMAAGLSLLLGLKTYLLLQLVVFCVAGKAGGANDEPLGPQAFQGLERAVVVDCEDRIPVVFLIGAVHHGVERQRILIGRGHRLLDQYTENTALVRRQFDHEGESNDNFAGVYGMQREGETPAEPGILKPLRLGRSLALPNGAFQITSRLIAAGCNRRGRPGGCRLRVCGPGFSGGGRVG